MVDRQQSHTQDIFPSVVGHQEIKEHLQAALVHDTVSHAYLFEGCLLYTSENRKNVAQLAAGQHL